MRHLVTIQEVKEIIPIENADAIELVRILGWQCVVKKGEFKAGDKGVYFEIDSYLPINDERYEFLRKSSYRNNPYMGEGFRIITQKFRGQLSQGLFLPLSQFPEITSDEIGTDVTELLNVVKWDPPEQTNGAGNIKCSFPAYGFSKTDEIRVQSMDELRTQLLGKPYYISTKMDGTSCTIYFNINGDKCGVCGRNSEYYDDDSCDMWKVVHQRNVMENLKKLNRPLVIQGEFCGEGIQKNRLKLKSPEIFVFNVIDGITMKLLHLDEMIDICEKINMITVPIEERGDSFNYTLEELLERAKGKYPSGQNKEGIVIRPLIPEFCDILCKELSFKVLNNDYLLKNK